LKIILAFDAYITLRATPMDK